jgi:septal ring factor EnvC (AmiA/AmiB activator)
MTTTPVRVKELRREIAALHAKIAKLLEDSGVDKLRRELGDQRRRAANAERQVRDLSLELQRERLRLAQAEARLKSLGIWATEGEGVRFR